MNEDITKYKVSRAYQPHLNSSWGISSLEKNMKNLHKPTKIVTNVTSHANIKCCLRKTGKFINSQHNVLHVQLCKQHQELLQKHKESHRQIDTTVKVSLVFQHYWKRANDSTRLIQQDFGLYKKILWKQCFPIKIAWNSDLILSSCKF